MADLGDYAQRFTRLNVNRSRGTASPHKPCMLLAVIDLIDDNDRPQNRFTYAPPLLERYHRYFEAVRGPNDWPNPHFPFFHLKKEGFWHLHAVPGREQVLAALDSVRTPRQVLENIEYVSLDDALFALLCDEGYRAELAEDLINHWFDRKAAELGDMIKTGRAINRYAQSLRHLRPVEGVRELPPAVRDPAFRRVVLEAYDYRCAATGTRIILPDESVLVQAAHIEPFAVACNDELRNGLALTPDMHWAMDKHVIAPGPDYKWYVSGQIDRRLPENRLLVELEGTPLILPKEQRFWPKREYLEWRREHLL